VTETPIRTDQESIEQPAAGAAGLDEGPAPDPAAPLVAESRKYRRRAQAAEKTAGDLQRELDRHKALLAERDGVIADLERRARIDALLLESDAVDLESARLLTELAVQSMSDPDVDEAVRELRRTKPFLFRHRPAGTSAQGARGEHAPHREADDAAAEAVASGRRADLLRYLRLKRRAPR
jgi:hypothetical protein